jgi:hypothetical protein
MLTSTPSLPFDDVPPHLRGANAQNWNETTIQSLANKIRYKKLLGNSPVLAKHPPRVSAHISSPEHRLLSSMGDAVPTGLWSSRGYGYSLHVVDQTTVLLMYETSISCILVDTEFVPSEYDMTVHRVPGHEDNSTIILKSGLTDLVFDRVTAFAGFCNQGWTPTVFMPEDYVRNPLSDFDILVQTFVEQYAFFELRGQSNWTELTNSVRLSLSSTSTDEELIRALEDILKPLKDGHVSVFNEDGEVVTSDEMSIQTQFNAEFENQSAVSDPNEYFVNQLVAWWEILASYMSGGLRGEPGLLLYGKLAESPRIGYLELISFDIEDDAGFFNLLSEAMDYLREETDGLVLDIRINFGGHDELALYVASYFASERTLAFSKRARFGDDLTDRQEIYLDPLQDVSQRYPGPVVLLTSQSTVSAAEIFTMTMKELPQVVHYGETTLGILSDILEHVMPNGLFFGLSNEEYSAADGTIFEGIGLAPDIVANEPLLPLAERQAGMDNWLTEAVAIAEDLTAQLPMSTESPTVSSPSKAASWRGTTVSVATTTILLVMGTMASISSS